MPKTSPKLRFLTENDVRNLPFCTPICAVWLCETGRFAMRNGTYRIPARFYYKLYSFLSPSDFYFVMPQCQDFLPVFRRKTMPGDKPLSCQQASGRRWNTNISQQNTPTAEALRREYLKDKCTKKRRTAITVRRFFAIRRLRYVSKRGACNASADGCRGRS